MKKQLILLSLTSSILLADTFINPLPSSVRSIDNGGVKSAIDAYKDGIGAELMDKSGVATDNSAMNILVLKYGETAKINNVTVVDQVVYGDSNPTTADLALAAKLTIDGAACNDGNAATSGETWLNGTCRGGSLLKISCKDILNSGLSIGSGTYLIDPDSNGPITEFNTYCDMTTNGGGWTLIFKRENGQNLFDITENYDLSNLLITNQLLMSHPTGRYAIFTVNDTNYKWFEYRDAAYNLGFQATVYDSLKNKTYTGTTTDGTGGTTSGPALFIYGTDIPQGSYLLRTHWGSQNLFWFDNSGSNILTTGSYGTTAGYEDSITLFVR